MGYFFSGCSDIDENQYQPTVAQHSQQQVQEYIVGIHPLHNPKRLMEVYGPIVEYINFHMPQAHFKLEASRNYEEFDKKLSGCNGFCC